ncbi:MAG: RIP metalloprotease RseP [Burkholderiales bacterium]|nr:RIP metalloprotease RseP [Burkholderiales bacterium]
MITIIIFILTISILVIIHEMGHYCCARLFNVKVINFSIGFGPKLFSFRSKSNLWSIGAIPLGGYVRMLDAREGDISAEDKPFAFNYKPPYQKILIAAAGPFFNLLFAFCLYYGLGLNGITNLRPVILSLNPEVAQINQINIPPNSIINSVNGVKIDSWEGLNNVLHQLAKKTSNFNIVYTYNQQQQQLNVDLAKQIKRYSANLNFEDLGLYPFKYDTTIGYIEPDSSAYKAHLEVGDKILAVNSQPILNWFALVKIIQSSPTDKLILTIQRQHKIINLPIIPESYNNNDQIIGKVGIMPKFEDKLMHQYEVTHKYNVLSALTYALSSSLAIFNLNISSLLGMISGKISVHNIGGPISIAQASKQALTNNIKSYIDLLALISISLAFMNILPIPILDGGHIVIYILEWIVGREIAYRVQLLFFKVGFMLLFGVTILAFYNDILRLN